VLLNEFELFLAEDLEGISLKYGKRVEFTLKLGRGFMWGCLSAIGEKAKIGDWELLLLYSI